MNWTSINSWMELYLFTAKKIRPSSIWLSIDATPICKVAHFLSHTTNQIINFAQKVVPAHNNVSLCPWFSKSFNMSKVLRFMNSKIHRFLMVTSMAERGNIYGKGGNPSLRNPGYSIRDIEAVLNVPYNRTLTEKLPSRRTDL